MSVIVPLYFFITPSLLEVRIKNIIVLREFFTRLCCLVLQHSALKYYETNLEIIESAVRSVSNIS